jgi:hypothetical protein
MKLKKIGEIGYGPNNNCVYLAKGGELKFAIK